MLLTRSKGLKRKRIKHNSNPTMITCVMCLVLPVLLTSGCMTLPRGTSLAHNTPSDIHINKEAWVRKADMLDPTVADRHSLENPLTLNILEYIREGKYFTDANLLPGEMGQDDLVLHFQFDLYEQKRSVHPAYFPLALGTLTFYIWFGGPIYVDSSDLSGKLIVEDFSGSKILEVNSKIEEEHNVSFWSPEYTFPSGIEGRTMLVKELLDKVVTKLY